MKNSLSFAIAGFLAVLSGPALSATQWDCLLGDLDSAYLTDTQGFWVIVDQKVKAAESCRDANDVAEFLKIYAARHSNAELNEYLARLIENMCLKKARCLRMALSRANGDTRAGVGAYLSRPLFVSSGQIQKARCISPGSVNEINRVRFD